MKINDAVWGALLMLLGAALLVYVQSFPTIPGQDYGPALFPGMIGAGLAVCGALLIMKGVAARRSGGLAFAAFDPWVFHRLQVMRFAVVIAVNVFYVAFVDRLGFVITGIVYLAALFTVFRVRARWIAPLALILTLVIHYAFYKLLRVPLPGGILQGFPW
jgi:putative tricarboxylic transport membrane protein